MQVFTLDMVHSPFVQLVNSVPEIAEIDPQLILGFVDLERGPQKKRFLILGDMFAGMLKTCHTHADASLGNLVPDEKHASLKSGD